MNVSLDSQTRDEQLPVILCVDDSTENLVSFEKTLRHVFPGARVLTASLWEEGMTVAARNDIDVALVDFHLPEPAQGIDLLRSLKADARTCDVPVIIITGYATTAEERAAILESGAADFIVKPCDPAEIGAKIRALLRSKRSEDRLRLELRRKIAELERSHVDLVSSRANFLNMIEKNIDGMVVLDQHRKVLFLNSAAEEIFGRWRDDLIGEPFELPLADEPFTEAIVPGADGEARTLEVWVTGTEWQGASAWLVSLRDVTAQRRLEEHLRQKQRLEAIGELAGGVAHDFNNMLQAILSTAMFIREDLPGDSPVLDDLASIEEAASKAADLTRQLLAFGRRQVLQPRNLDLNQLVRQALKMLRRVIGEDVDVAFVEGPSLGTVRADPGQVEQVLVNLSVNARDAMPDGGCISVATRNVMLDEEHCVRHAWARPGRYVMLSVTDTGTGMDEVTRDRIFEPFFTTKEVGKGTGLGLATIYGIVQQHEGLIHVDSVIGRGSVLSVYLPVVEAAPDVVRRPSIISAGGAETILLAEDDQGVRFVTCRHLERAGYTVLTAADGREAVETFSRSPDGIDLVLLDVVMPVLGGKEACEAIKRLRPDQPVLFVSGYSASAVHTRFVLDEGMHLLEKPYRKDRLLEKVRELLDS